MSSKISQGQGDSTEAKVRGLETAFSINTRIIRNKLPRATYFHFDLNAGTGWNEEVGCKGSPLAFIDAAQKVGINYRAYFVDKSKKAYSELRQRIGSDPRHEVVHGDNALFARLIPKIIERNGDRPAYAVGSVLSDPNGTGIPFDQLAELSRRCPCLDIIVNWNSIVFNRVRLSPAHPGTMTLEEAIKLFNKEHWLIREPLSCQKFSLLIGRNIQTGSQRGFYRLDSEQGRSIFRRLNYTNAERLTLAGQGDLF